MFMHAKNRARRAGTPFEITFSEVKVPAVCPLLGIPLEWATGRYAAGTPSLDRINPALGYVPGNVWVVSWRANAIKRDATLAELASIVRGLSAKIGQGG